MAGSEAALLTRMFQAAVASVAADLCLPPHLPPPPRGRTIVVGAGKAAAMAGAVALDGHPGIHAIACDTDGIDGTEGNAGSGSSGTKSAFQRSPTTASDRGCVETRFCGR